MGNRYALQISLLVWVQVQSIEEYPFTGAVPYFTRKIGEYSFNLNNKFDSYKQVFRIRDILVRIRILDPYT
jgi:hypothetical protein